jgi:hypothetical protein
MLIRACERVRLAGWLLVFSVAALAAPGASANQAHLAGPSVLHISSAASFKGGNFAPGTAVTVVVRQPNGAESAHSLMVDSSGKIAYTMTPKAEGLYTIRVTDSGGRVLATAHFNAHQ